MTLLFDASSPPVCKSDPTAVNVLTTAAFTPPASSLLIMAALLDTNNAAATITASSPTGSTSAWTTVESWGVTGHGVVAIFTATVTSSISTTARVSYSSSSDCAMNLDVYTGANGIGSHGHATITSNPTVISYTPTVIGSIAYFVVEDYAGNSVTISNTTTAVGIYSASQGKITYQTSPATSLSPQSFSVAGSAGSQALVWAEVQPAGAAGPAGGGSLDLTASFSGSGVTNAGLSSGGGLAATAVFSGDGVVGWPQYAGNPVVVISITVPPTIGGFADTVVVDLYRTGPEWVPVRIAANLPPGQGWLDLLPGAGPNIYTAVSYSASGASTPLPQVIPMTFPQQTFAPTGTTSDGIIDGGIL